MSSGYALQEIKKEEDTLVVAGGTEVQVGNEFKISAEGSLNLRIEALVSAAVAGTTLNMILQHGVTRNASDAKIDWQNVKTVAIATSTPAQTVSLVISAVNDPTLTPLRPHGRIVFTTSAGASITVTALNLIQER